MNEPERGIQSVPMLSEMQRIVIIGSSGSGKSYLARKLGAARGIPIIHLDRLVRVPGGFNLKRPPEVVREEIDVMALDESWIVEGVFGDLAGRFFPRAVHLIWLDIPWSVCRDGLIERGSESDLQRDPESAARNHALLLEWAEDYWNRTGVCSHVGHHQLFDQFQGTKQRITSRESMDQIACNDPSIHAVFTGQ